MKILEFPQLMQTYEYDCGAKALQEVLAYYGIELREDLLIKKLGTNESGTPVKRIVQVAKKYNLKCILRKMNFIEVKSFIDKGIPVILLLQAWTCDKNVNWKRNWKDGHYVVAIGYDDEKIYFEDPYSFKRTFLKFDELKKRWHDKDKKGNKYINYGIAIYGKKPVFTFKKAIHMN